MHVTQKINILASEIFSEAGLELHKELQGLGWDNEQQAAAILQGLTFFLMSFSHEDVGQIYGEAHKDALPAMIKWREYHKDEYKKNNN